MKTVVSFNNGKQYSFCLHMAGGLRKVFQTFLGDDAATVMKMQMKSKTIAERGFDSLSAMVDAAEKTYLYPLEVILVYPTDTQLKAGRECKVEVIKHAGKAGQEIRPRREGGDSGADNAGN